MVCVKDRERERSFLYYYNRVDRSDATIYSRRGAGYSNCGSGCGGEKSLRGGGVGFNPSHRVRQDGHSNTQQTRAASVEHCGG